MVKTNDNIFAQYSKYSKSFKKKENKKKKNDSNDDDEKMDDILTKTEEENLRMIIIPIKIMNFLINVSFIRK